MVQPLIDFMTVVLDRAFDIVKAPIENPNMLWILIPLLITLLLMEFYFGIYKEELLGWNTAFSNSIVLIFVGSDLLRFMYTNNLVGYNLRTLITLIVLIEGILLILINLFHLLPKRLAFNLSAKTPINFIGAVVVILVYTSIPLDLVTLVALFVLFLILLIVVGAIHKLEPSVSGELSEEAPPSALEENAPRK